MDRLVQVRDAAAVAEPQDSRACEPREAACMLAQSEVPWPCPARARASKAGKMQSCPAHPAGRVQHRCSPSPWQDMACLQPMVHVFSCAALSGQSSRGIRPAPCNPLPRTAAADWDQNLSMSNLKACSCLKPQSDRPAGGLKSSCFLTDVFAAGEVISFALCFV